MNYEILYDRAGSFKKGEIVSEEQIEQAGSNLDFWLAAGAVKAVAEDVPDESTPDAAESVADDDEESTETKKPKARK